MAKEIELLAPAGSYESLIAGIKSGADAVYVGGSKFGARAFAGNFDQEELKKAIDYVHLNHKKIFLTINTLLKEDELNHQLYEYILPLYEHGLDAVIVQDIGVLNFIREYFPDLPIHASTQMTVTNIKGVEFLQDLGVERVVTSRELTLKEVHDITSHTTLEVESFVHGALCYAYSGQCIYSSLVGGRSGNRGQCAQPCRLPYEINGKTGHYLSLKDICTLEHIDKLIESGVYSFKIEGRMKKPEYVALVTSMYRKYIDSYLSTGKLSVTTKDMDMLRDIFSRGEFHSGYWLQQNGPEMITYDKPSHTGVPLLKAVKQEGRMLTVEVIKELNKGDIIDILDTDDNYTFGKDYHVGERFELSLRKGVKIKSGNILNRTRNNSLIDRINEELERNTLQQGVSAFGNFSLGQESQLTLILGDLSVTVYGDVVEKAHSRAINLSDVEKQIKQTGNTPFYFESLELYLDDAVFIPLGKIKALRRAALLELEEVVVKQYRRNIKVSNEVLKAKHNIVENGEKIESNIAQTHPQFSIHVEKKEQLLEVLKDNIFDRIYLEYKLLMDDGYDTNDNLNIHDIYVVLPHIIRQRYLTKCITVINTILKAPIKGVVIRNIETFQMLKEIGYDGEIILDHHIHILNNRSRKYWLEQEQVKLISASPELTGKELLEINHDKLEVCLYGYSQMMISAQCVKKNTTGCDKLSGVIELKDRKNASFPIKSQCDFCYNIIYNNTPTILFNEEALSLLKVTNFKISLSEEDKSETSKVIKMVRDFKENKEVDILTDYTIGNFLRGIR